MQRVKKIIYIVVQIQAVEKKDCWKQNNQKHLYQGTYEHESSSQRWVTLGESRQVKLLFYCAPTADFKSIAVGNCMAENISVWLKTQDIASVFSPWAEQQLSQKKKKKSPSLQFICNEILLDTVFFIQNSLWVFLTRQEKVSPELSFAYSAN